MLHKQATCLSLYHSRTFYSGIHSLSSTNPYIVSGISLKDKPTNTSYIMLSLKMAGKERNDKLALSTVLHEIAEITFSHRYCTERSFAERLWPVRSSSSFRSAKEKASSSSENTLSKCMPRILASAVATRSRLPVNRVQTVPGRNVWRSH